MQSPRRDPEPSLIRLVLRGHYLYANSQAFPELDLPVYVYGLLEDGLETLLSPETVRDESWIDHWPRFIQPFGLRYVPIPVVRDLPSGEPIKPGDFASQVRDSARRPWAQLVYRGYPLYLFGDGSEDQDARQPQDSVKTLFRQARTTMKRGPIVGVPIGEEADPGIGLPPVNLGP